MFQSGVRGAGGQKPSFQSPGWGPARGGTAQADSIEGLEGLSLEGRGSLRSSSRSHLVL